MKTRVISAIVVIAIVLFCMAFHPVSRLIFVGVLGLGACHEILNAFKQAGYKPLLWPAYLFWIASCGIIIAKLDVQWIVFSMVLITILAFIQKCLKPTITDKDLFASLVPMIYPLLFMTLIVNIVWNVADYWPMIFISGVLAVVLCDTFALFTGKAFGKHKLSPVISPNKTVEGLIGGMIFGTLSGLAVYFLLPVFDLPVMNLAFCLIAAFFASGVGVFGDLAASSVKREAGIKDFSKLIPGHGGILDRIDSSIFAIPVVYMIFTIFQLL